jgi:hypothetical protein
MDPQPSTFPAQIDPAYAGAVLIVAGTFVKLSDVAGPNIVVTPTLTATDGPIFGVIPYNKRKNQYVAGDTVEVVGNGGVVMLKLSGATARGDNVAVANITALTSDPTVVTTTTAGQFIGGVALGKGTTNDLIKIKIAPGKITASDAVTTAATP